jgi:hypothetical protein
MNLDPLIKKAIRSVPAREANSAIDAMRHEQAVAGQDALSYEMVADPDGTLETFADRTLPKLVYFLDCRGVRLPLGPGAGIFISLFVGDALHFFHAGDVVDVLKLGLSYETLLERYGLHEEENGNERAPADGSGARELKLLPKA